ncbi:MAG: TetR/AcrR family transcriptional regulator [Desulfuromonas sp.]|nr:MAG: TetR/AcrR family transcriptional regulator [Desulfuromonas sp.]
MAQRLKQEVRERILAAAVQVYAEQGYGAARLVDIADRAQVGTGNLYRYFKGKEALFNELVTPALAAELLRRLRRRMRELADMKDWGRATVAGADGADALLEFWVEQREVVIILLSGAEGTRLAHVRSLVHSELSRQAGRYIRMQEERVGKEGTAALAPVPRFVLTQIFAGTIEMIIAILRQYREPKDIREAFANFWRYQLHGLQALLTVSGEE